MAEKQYHGPMSFHMCMNIETALAMAWNKTGNPFGDDGFYKIRDILGYPEGTNQFEIINGLEDMKKEGYTAIPGEGCDRHAAGHCKGHVRRGVKLVQRMEKN